MPVQVGHEAVHLQAVRRDGSDAGSIRGPVDHDHPQARDPRRGAAGTPRPPGAAGARPTPEPPTRDDADQLAGPVAELGPQRRRRSAGRPVAARHVARRSRSAPRSTSRIGGSPAPSASVDDVGRVADEHRPVAQRAGSARRARPSRRCSRRSARASRRAAVGHRQPADEVGHPGERRPLELGVLVQEVVEVPAPRRRPTGRTARRSTRSSKTMKLATRISSIRRIAWNACRSCSPASDSMCALSLASNARRRVHPLAALAPAPR